jgi:hypothetical protein
MTALDIYYVIHTRDHDRRWDGEQLLIRLDCENILNFCSLTEDYLSTHFTETRLSSDGSVWIDLVPVCEYYGIDPEELFSKEKP